MGISTKYKQIKIMVLPNEYEKIKKNSEMLKLKMSGYCRKMLNVENKLDTEKKSEIDLEMIYHINKIGNNLNQITKYVNIKKEIDSEVLLKIDDIFNNLKKLIKD